MRKKRCNTSEDIKEENANAITLLVYFPSGSCQNILIARIYGHPQ